MAVAKFVQMILLIAVAGNFVRTHQLEIRSLSGIESTGLLWVATRLLGELFLQLAISLLVWSGFDFGVRYWWNEQKLKMSISEYRREQRDESLDPRSRRRQAASQKSVANPGIQAIDPGAAPRQALRAGVSIRSSSQSAISATD